MKQTKVLKFYEFIFEGNTPEDFMSACLTKIKNKIDPLFDNSDDNIKSMKDFNNANLSLLKSDISKYNPSEYSLKIKFADDHDIMYVINIILKLEDAMKTDKETDFNIDDIKKAYVTFDKYGDKDGKYTVVDQLLERSVEPSKIDGDYIIKLKMELDKGKGETKDARADEEEFKIETE
jgi:hypothetical protein